MKKLVSVVLVFAMIVSLVSLTGCTSSISKTKTFTSFDILDSDTYTFDVNMAGSRILLYRSGNSFYADMLGEEVLIVDLRRYEFDDDEKIAYYTTISESEFNEMIKKFNRPDVTLIDLKGASLIDSGTNEFRGQMLNYEKIKDSKGIERYVYFDGDTILGYSENGIEIGLHIVSTVPADAFALPADYEVRARS
jgi:hypothetical protein